MKYSRRQFLMASAATLATTTSFGAVRKPAVQMRRIFVGTYTDTISKGIYSLSFDSLTGQIGAPVLAFEMNSPGNLVVSPDQQFLYACAGRDSTLGGENTISSFAIQGLALKRINMVASGGTTPTHGSVDRARKYLYTTNYSSDNVVAFRLSADGAIGERTALLGKPFSTTAIEAKDWNKPHDIALSKSERFAVVPEINTDRCLVYRVNAGTLQLHQTVNTPPHSGPRHFLFHPNNRFAFSSNEVGSSATSYAWNEVRGELTPIQTISTVPENFTDANRVSDLEIHPSGKFLYVANRGHNSLAIFAIDARTGELTPRGHATTLGKTPWCFAIDPNGKWCIASNMGSDNIAVFAIDSATGMLTPTGQEAQVGKPTCLRLI